MGAAAPIPTLLGLGASSSGGKKGGKSNTGASREQMALARQLLQQSDPVRQSMVDRSMAFLGTPQARPVAGGDSLDLGRFAGLLRGGGSGIPNKDGSMSTGQPAGFDVRNSPTYQAYQLDANRNFGRAKDNLIGRFAPGGAMQDAMGDLEANRAYALTQGASNIYQSELDRAMALATGLTNTASSNLLGAGSVQAQLAGANAQQNAATKNALGTAAGMYMGSK